MTWPAARHPFLRPVCADAAEQGTVAIGLVGTKDEAGNCGDKVGDKCKQ